MTPQQESSRRQSDKTSSVSSADTATADNDDVSQENAEMDRLRHSVCLL